MQNYQSVKSFGNISINCLNLFEHGKIWNSQVKDYMINRCSNTIATSIESIRLIGVQVLPSLAVKSLHQLISVIHFWMECRCSDNFSNIPKILQKSLKNPLEIPSRSPQSFQIHSRSLKSSKILKKSLKDPIGSHKISKIFQKSFKNPLQIPQIL